MDLYETFLAGCYEKAEEIDDSGGTFGEFVERLHCDWVRARQAAGADAAETARTLLAWMDDDPYGFCYWLDRSLVRALDERGLDAFARQVRERIDDSQDTTSHRRNRWIEALKRVRAAQGDVEPYVALCEETETTAENCKVVADLLEGCGDAEGALAWVDRGLGLAAEDRGGMAAYGLERLRRSLLARLGRGELALEDAWRQYRASPGLHAYEELMAYVPEEEHAAWHERAMEAAAGADLRSAIGLLLETEETDRLVARLRAATDQELVAQSHHTTEPAAEHLEESHPDVAARVHQALGLRIVDAGKSKYYHSALSHLERARDCYEQAGQPERWEELVERIRGAHGRKYSFMPGFERLVAGQGPSQEPSFLERARQRWQPR